MNIQDQIRDALHCLSNIVSIHLFGSQHNGTASSQSDVDIAILFKWNFVPSPMQLLELRETISDSLEKDVDLVCLNNASPIIAMQVVKNGEELQIKDKKDYYKYLITLFTDYADLKMLRHDMETNITKRKYYG